MCVEAYSPAAVQRIDLQIVSSSDDAEERLGSGRVGLVSSDLDLTNDGGVNQIVGVRFAAMPVPQGATIKSSYLQFTTDEPAKSPLFCLSKARLRTTRLRSKRNSGIFLLGQEPMLLLVGHQRTGR